MQSWSGQKTREDGRHWLPSQGVDPAPLTELNAECLGLLVRPRRRRSLRCINASAGIGAARAMGFPDGAGRAPSRGRALQPVRCRASHQQRAGSSCADVASMTTTCAPKRSISNLRRRARSRAACSYMAGTWRAAGRGRPAWCSDARLHPSSRSPHVRSRCSRPRRIATRHCCDRAGLTNWRSGANC